MTWMQTLTGQPFDLANPNPNHVSPYDIAWSLGRQCRYTGHSMWHMSVAQHCCLISDALLRDTGDPEIAFAGLMHDAAEAYTGDVGLPLKQANPALREALAVTTRKVEGAISEAIGWDMRKCHAPLIKEYDTRILLDERAIVMSDTQLDWGLSHEEPLGVGILEWPATYAGLEWLRRFDTLRPPHNV